MKTGNKPGRLRCSLGAMQPVKIDTEEVKRDGWNNQRILVVAMEDKRLGWIEKEFVRQIGEKLYGTKKGDRRE